MDDEEDVLRQSEEGLADVAADAEILTETSFVRGLERVESEDYDVVVLDLRLGGSDASSEDQNAGNRLAAEIRRRRFVPIVFFTALPESAEPADTPFVQVVPKPDGIMKLRTAVIEMLATGVPKATRAVDEHVQAVRRDFLWDLTSKDWKRLSASMNSVDLGYLLARRLAASLSMSGIQSVNEGLGPLLSGATGAHPHFFYVMPPVTSDLRFGDLVRANQTFSVVLTATCDLVSTSSRKPKAEQVLLGACKRIKTQREFKKAKQGDDQAARADLKSIMRNNAPKGRQKDRCFFMPPALKVPALLLDLQELRTETLSGVRKLERVASMDSPFAEVLTSQFSRYYGRVAAPDLDVDGVADGLLH